MDVRLIRDKNKRYITVAYDGGDADGGPFILASMTLHEGTGCWQVVDIRLSEHRKPSPYSGGLQADVLSANYKPENEAERELVKSMLREYIEQDDGAIVWCTYDGIVKGHDSVNGYRPVGASPAGYFSYQEALKLMCDIHLFWDGFTGDPATVRLDNPHRQPSMSEVHFRIANLRLGIDLPSRATGRREGLGDPSPPMSQM